MSDLDVTMAEANTSHTRNSTPSSNPAYYRNVTFVEGFSKTSVNLCFASLTRPKFYVIPIRYAT